MSINKTVNNFNKDKNILIKGGLDTNLVINKNYLNSLGDIYKCSLCQKIMLNPVECEICGHNYCYNCLNSLNCPFGCENKKINKASLSIYNILNNLKFSCKNIGCTESIEYNEVEKHINECPYQKIKCKNEGCERIILRKDIFNHNKNECDYFKIKCKFCNNEFIKKDIQQHENECSLKNNEKEKFNYKSDNTSLEEYLKQLSDNLNNIIKDNRQLVEIIKSKKEDENTFPNRISIRKSIVPGLEDDEFFNILKEQLETKLKEYYLNFDNKYKKILEEIEDLKILLNNYIQDRKNNGNKIIGKNNFEDIKKYLNNSIKKIETELKNVIIEYNNNISKEFINIKNILENKTEGNNNSKSKKDMYSLINIMFNNLSKFLFETNDNINSLYNLLSNQLNNLYNFNNNNILEPKKQNYQIENVGNKLIKDELEIINNEKINNINNDELKKNKKIFLNNINRDLTELKNNIAKSINIINENFADFSDLINHNCNNLKKDKYEICQASSFSLKNSLKGNTEIKNIIGNPSEIFNNKTELISLNNINSKLTFLENSTKQYFSQIKKKLSSEIKTKLNEINRNIEKDMDEKIDLLFSLNHCKECEKVDYFFGFIKCRICSNDICKQCISLCIKCKNFCCSKCCFCKKCKNSICKICRTKCISCKEYYCQLCLSNCIYCNNNICLNCNLEKCSLCNNNNFCTNCFKKCHSCKKVFCEKCIKNIEFSQCYFCINNICINCFKKCKEHNNIICSNCSDECNKCNNNYCKQDIIECNHCHKKFCKKCEGEFMKNNNCKLCKNIFCKECYDRNNNNILKCFSCNKKPCFICFSKCVNCSKIFCRDCSNICQNCTNISCINCSYECICEKYFCVKCISLKEIIYPHDCIYFLNNCAITDSKKIISLKKIHINFNIEAKFSVLMTDISDKSFLLVGIIDDNTNKERNDKENSLIFAMNVNNGNKFSSKKGFESFLDFDDIKEGINYVFIMIKEKKLFFKINESIYKWAYDLDKKRNYWFYIENNIHGSITKFLYIRKIK